MINIKNLNVVYGEKVIFEDACLAINKGIYILSGEKSCGKSTLLNLVYEKGIKNILYTRNDADVFDVEGEVFILQDNMGMADETSEIEFLNTIAILNGMKQPFSYEPLYQEKPLSTYSTGELKVAQINLLTELNPDILLLDEPFQSSESKHNEYILNKIMKRDSNKITIVVTDKEEYKNSFVNNIQILDRKILIDETWGK
jgi:energy-coupling factor transporter ATP-binding protein EcfA2